MKRWFNPQGVLIVLLAATVAGALMYFLNIQQRQLNTGILLQAARTQAEMLTQVRNFYLEEVVNRVEGTDVIVSHDFHDRDNAIPIPATMTIE